MLVIHRQYDDIVLIQRPQYHLHKISPSGDHPVLAIDLKPTASCWSKDCKQFDSEDFSEIQPLPRLGKELASRPWAGSQYNFSGGVFSKSRNVDDGSDDNDVVWCRKELFPPRRSNCSIELRPVCSAPSPPTITPKSKVQCTSTAKFNACSMQILKVQCQIQVMRVKQIYRRRCAECARCSLVVWGLRELGPPLAGSKESHDQHWIGSGLIQTSKPMRPRYSALHSV